MRKFKEWILYELTKEPDNRKLSMSGVAGRLLAGFFVLMLLLTMISRAADSVIIAKIEVAKVNRGELNFIVEGTGTIVEKAVKYLDIYEGIRIKSTVASIGDSIEKDDFLFQYDVGDLEVKLDDLEDELRKAEIDLEINNLNNDSENPGMEIQKAELTLERTKLDLKTAKSDLNLAKRETKKEKKEAYFAAKESYEEATATRDEQAVKKDKAIQNASDAVNEAADNLKYVSEEKTKAEVVISEYKTAVENPYNNAISTAETNIFKQYYGEKEYLNHQKEVKKLEKALYRAEEDYSDVKELSTEQGIELTEHEKAIYLRAIEDAEDNLSDKRTKDAELTTAILIYNNAIQNKNSEAEGTAYVTLFNLVYTEDSDKRKQIKDANDAILDAQEVLSDTIIEWDKTMKEEDETVKKTLKSFEEAEVIYNQIMDDTYDYSQDVKMEERDVESANRAVEDAKLSLEEVKIQDAQTVSQNGVKDQITNLNQESSEIDIREKEESVDEVRKLLKNEGKVMAPISGTLSVLEVLTGRRTSGDEKVCITTGSYGFTAKVTNEEAKHLATGDEIDIQTGNSNDKVTVSIETIGIEDSEGKIEISGILPKGEYTAGETAAFTVKNQSQKYEQIIPIQALRMDAKGIKYVLVTKEKSTILGNELIASRINVTLIDRDNTTAAIEGVLMPEDNLIINSNKNIEEGDRVRIYENKE